MTIANIAFPFVLSLSKHERLSPPFDRLRTGFDKLRANGWLQESIP